MKQEQMMKQEQINIENQNKNLSRESIPSLEELQNLNMTSQILQDQIMQKQNELKQLNDQNRVDDEMLKMRMDKINSMDNEVEKITNLRVMMEEQLEKIAQVDNQFKTRMEKEEEIMKACPTYPKPNVYVDVGCFLDKMNNLSNKTNDYMIDLSLLTSNVKSCSYISKDDTEKKGHIKVDMEGNLVEQVIDKIGNNVGMERENFGNLENVDGFMSQFGWSNLDLIKLIVLLLIIYMLLVNKKKF
jgi:DNA repair exonuclease SbcCD ATPase subunit